MDDKFIIHAIALWSVVNAGMIKVLLHLLWVLVVVTSPLNKVRLPLSVSKIFERKGNSRRGKVHHQPQNERREEAAVDQAHVETLMALGFGRDQVVQALRVSNGDVDAAAGFLFDNGR